MHEEKKGTFMSVKQDKKRTRSKEEDFNWGSFERNAIERLKIGEELGGKDGILAPMIKRILKASLEAEITVHLENERVNGLSNRLNGMQSKGLKTEYGKIKLETHRDRTGSFDPQLVKKRQTTIGEGLDNKIISMYGRGMSYEEIRSHLEELYRLEMSKAALSQITDKVLPVLDEWRERRLNQVYPIVWMDALVFKVRQNGHIEKRAVFCVLGINEGGMKDLLGLYIAENEGSRF